jgi:excisionase family DNA binding protein
LGSKLCNEWGVWSALVLVSDVVSVTLEVDVLQDRLTVTVEEAGELLGISRAHAYESVRRGDLPSIRLGRRIVVPVHRLWTMLNEDENAVSVAS